MFLNFITSICKFVILAKFVADGVHSAASSSTITSVTCECAHFHYAIIKWRLLSFPAKHLFAKSILLSDKKGEREPIIINFLLFTICLEALLLGYKKLRYFTGRKTQNCQLKDLKKAR